MLLKSCFIDGFGCFRNKEFVFPKSNFILILGENEAGKSTLFSFLRGQLSGFNRINKKENHYLPLYGGKHGGSITIEHEKEELKLARYVKSKNFEFLNEPNSKNIKPHIERLQIDDYRSLFAFDLDELKSLSLLDSKDLTERLFSSGVSGANNYIAKGIEDLKNNANQIYRQRSKAELQEVYEDYLSLKDQLKEAELRNQEVEALSGQLENSRLELGLLETEKLKLNDLLKKLDKENIKKDLKLKLANISCRLEPLRNKKFPLLAEQDREHFLRIRLLELNKNVCEIKSELLDGETLRKDQEKIESERHDFDKLNDSCRLASEFKFGTSTHEIILLSLATLSGAWILANYFFDFGFKPIFNSVLAIITVSLVSLFFIFRNKRQNKEATVKENIRLKEEQLRAPLSLHTQTLGNLNLSSIEEIDSVLKKLDRTINRNNLLIENKTNLESKCNEVVHELQKIYQKFDVKDAKAFDALKQEGFELENISRQEDEFIKIAAAQGYNLNQQDDYTTDVTLEEAQAKLEETLKKQDELKKVINKYEILIARQTSSSEIEEIRQEMIQRKECANALFREWQSLMLAEQVLKQTILNMYASKYASVLKQASLHINSFTKGEYVEVFLGEDEKDINVKKCDGAVLKLPELSRGTVEQVYLSMRLALARVYGEKFGSFPLIFDDILVNFDDQRAEAALLELSELSKNHQVLFFTCHNWIAEKFKKVTNSEDSILRL